MQNSRQWRICLYSRHYVSQDVDSIVWRQQEWPRYQCLNRGLVFVTTFGIPLIREYQTNSYMPKHLSKWHG